MQEWTYPIEPPDDEWLAAMAQRISALPEQLRADYTPSRRIVAACDHDACQYDVFLHGEPVGYVYEVCERENWAVLSAKDKLDWAVSLGVYFEYRQADNFWPFPTIKVFAPFRLVRKVMPSLRPELYAEEKK